MQIRYHKKFEKRFKKLSAELKEKTIVAIAKFSKSPFHSSLKNHPLKGQLAGKRAFSVTSNVRVIFEEYDNYVLVVLLDLGTHNQVY